MADLSDTDAGSSSEEEDTDPSQDPTTVFNSCYLRAYFQRDAKFVVDAELYGKWLVFKDRDQLDETWRMIRDAVQSGNLQGCVYTKCSTMCYNPSEAGPGPSTVGVVMVHTKRHNVDDIGFALIQLVQQDIRYKTDKDSSDYKYAFTIRGKVSNKILYWNSGKPSFKLTGELCDGTTPNKEDIWHVNIVKGPEVICSEEEHGKWILTLEYEDLTELWHYLKPRVESGRWCVMKMECPAKRCHKSPHEKPVFLFYTSYKHRDKVGQKLIQHVRKDLKYEQNKPVNGVVRFDALYWNGGEPVYGRDHELTDEEYSGDPTKICDSPWISVGATGDAFGKWLVFCDYRHLDETWKTIKAAIESDSLQGCVSAKCSTMYYNPTEAGVGPSTEGVIYVYTEEHNVDDIGFKLVELVRRDIRYKTEVGFKSSHLSETLFWNNGRPSFQGHSRSSHDRKEDIWHVNVVRGPEPVCHEVNDGKWILTVERHSLTELWHILKRKVESEVFGVTEMVCPAKKYRSSPHEKPSVFHIYTSYRHKDDVGEELIEIVEKDIEFEHNKLVNGRVRFDTLYWNEGDPSYERMKVVDGPGALYFEKDQGRWIINLECEELWDQLEEEVESEDFGAIKMERPTNVGPYFRLKRPVLYIYTSYKHKDKVGEKSIEIVQRDIQYEHKKLVNGRIRFDTLYWNDGEPAYERINRKGITKNWRNHP